VCVEAGGPIANQACLDHAVADGRAALDRLAQPALAAR